MAIAEMVAPTVHDVSRPFFSTPTTTPECNQGANQIARKEAPKEEEVPLAAEIAAPAAPVVPADIKELLHHYKEELKYLWRLPHPFHLLGIENLNEVEPIKNTSWDKLYESYVRPLRECYVILPSYFLNLGERPLKNLNKLISPKTQTDVKIASINLKRAQWQLRNWKPPSEVSDVSKLLFSLPYVGALQFITNTRWYYDRCWLMNRSDTVPPESQLIRKWLSLPMKAEAAALSYAKVTKRFHKTIGYVDPIPPYLLSLLPFKPNAQSWKEGLSDPKIVAQALEIIKEIDKVDLCLRLPPNIIDPCLKEGTLLATLVHQWRAFQAEQKRQEKELADPDHYRREGEKGKAAEQEVAPRWLKVKFPQVPIYLLQAILGKHSLSEILNDPDKLSHVLSFLKQIEFIELLTLLPEEAAELFFQDQRDNFRYHEQLKPILQKAKTALKRNKELAPITPELAKELFFFHPETQLNGQELERISRAPRSFVMHARYLSNRIAKEGAAHLEGLRQKHGFLPLSQDEKELVRGVLKNLMAIDGYASAIWRAPQIALQIYNYGKAHPFLINPNIYAHLDECLGILAGYSEIERWKILENVHHLFITGLNDKERIPGVKNFIAKVRRIKKVIRQPIADDVEHISQGLAKLSFSYPELRTPEGDVTLKNYLDWVEKNTKLSEPFFGVGGTYIFRYLKTILCPQGVDQSISLGQLLIQGPEDQGFRYNPGLVFKFLTNAITVILRQQLKNYPNLYSEDQFEALPGILQRQFALHPSLAKQTQRGDLITQEELIDTVENTGTETIEFLKRLFLEAKEPSKLELNAIALRKQRINALNWAKTQLLNDSMKRIAEKQEIIDANSSFLPWRTFTEEQQRLCKIAEQAKQRLIEDRDSRCKLIDAEIRCRELQIQISERHGPAEILDLLAWVLGLKPYPVV